VRIAATLLLSTAHQMLTVRKGRVAVVEVDWSDGVLADTSMDLLLLHKDPLETRVIMMMMMMMMMLW
jgi:steroid 5-alpha reductase family enzyme